MEIPIIFKIILLDGTSQRLTLPYFPQSIDELYSHVKSQCAIQCPFKLQFMDTLFGNDFLNLTCITEIENRCTLRIVCLESTSEGGLSESDQDSVSRSPLLHQSPEAAHSSPVSPMSCVPWPAIFHIPSFSYDTDLKLQQADLAFTKNGTLLTDIDPKMKSDILSGLLQEVLKYGVYISGKQREQVVRSLIEKHPCLRERGSDCGFSAWKTSLKDKLSNYRCLLRKIGCPEVTVNSLKHKPEGCRKAALGVKKPKRAEVNFLPDYPVAETQTSLQAIQESLLMDVQIRNNRENIKLKMEKTFALRRQEIIGDMPLVADFKARWPALFDIAEINAEFRRITTVPLQSKFLSQLDLYSEELLKIFQKKGGQVGKKLESVLEGIADCEVDAGRERVLKALCVYMGEEPGDLLQEFEVCMTTPMITMRIPDRRTLFISMGRDRPLIPLLQSLESVPLAFVMLFGLIYALNLSYPQKLSKTFEFFQKVLMEMDVNSSSPKILSLKNRLLK
ncbi:hypothetical protein ACEWY4_005887 [Coilia grayii]|uniref:Uncharacterized protein n=1 Tax=Coilia grayii TaxID=363190 RepID=A0ABD1KJY1_9TELE